MKPEPLDLKDIVSKWEEEKDIAKKDGDSGYATICSFVIKDLKQTIQRIKLACEFYLRYKDNPKLLRKEHPEYKKDVEDFIVVLGQAKNAFDFWVRKDEYNKWLFKLTFKSVFKEEDKE